MITCKHNNESLCGACSKIPPYWQFKLCKTQCLNCKECGYFYGLGAKEELRGKHVIWNIGY